MNIALFSDPLTHQVGGAFVSTLRFAQKLTRRGHKVILIAARYPNTAKVDFYNSIKVYRFFGIQIPKFQKRLYISFPTVSDIKKILIKEKIQIVHVTIPTPAGVSAIRAARKLGLGVVAHSHSQPENMFLHLPRILQSSALYKSFYKYVLWFYNKADIVICPTQFAEDKLKELDPKLKTCVISNGVDLRTFRKVNSKKFQKQYGLSTTEHKLLYVGRLDPEKSIETLIGAMPLLVKKLKNVKLIIVGGGNLQASLETYALALGVQNNVKFLGRIPDKELVCAYSSCDIFALASLAELEGMVVLEAMACGRPLLVANSKDSASPYLVQGNGFLFKSKDSKDFAKKAIMILSNKTLRSKMSKRSLQLRKWYDINESVRSIERVYRDVLVTKNKFTNGD